MTVRRKIPAWISSLISYMLMYLLWSAWHSFIRPVFNPSDTLGIWVDILVKTIIWLSPLLCSLHSKEGWLIHPKTMFSTPFPWFACLAMLCVTTAFLHTVRIAAGRLNTFIIWENIFFVLSISAGVIEEISFRGFLFNRQSNAIGILPAAILNGVMFTLFHYPCLIIGQGIAQLFSLRSLMLFSVGVWFSLSFARWKNITLLIIIHSIWNILSYYFTLAG